MRVMVAELDTAAEPTQIHPDWLTTREAAKLLSVSPVMLLNQRVIREAVDHRRSRGANGTYLWSRADLDDLIDARKRFSVRTTTAARVLKELREGQPTKNQ